MRWGNFARFYGLPKTHKPNNRLRLIVSFCGSPTYNLASFYNNIILKNTTPPTPRIKNSFDFIEKVKNTRIPSGYKIISLDAVSLFTNVQIRLAMKSIKLRWSQIQPHVKMPWYQFEKGIRTCFTNSAFNFQGIFFKQKSGFPMGSPLSPIAADIDMDDLEKKCIDSLPFQVPFYFRYADDILTVVPVNEIDTIKKTFNSHNHKIQFQIEEKSENKICFLDFLVIKDGENIKTNWYQKPTWSGRLLNFHSHHPLKYKINIINNLVDRGITLAHKNIKKIKMTLIKNNYIQYILR